MNDSFLADLELVSSEQKAGSTVHRAERNITTRCSQPSPVSPSPDQDELNFLIAKQSSKPKIAPGTTEAKVSHRRSVDSGETGKEHVHRHRSKDIRPENVKCKVPERRAKPGENKLKPVENVDFLEVPKPKVNTKERPRWSGGSNKESSRCSDGSSKENSRPSDSSKESLTHGETPREHNSRGSGDGPTRDAHGKFEVAMLNSVKEIVSTYTKNESAKILRAMQEYYINSQSNLIKLMIQQTDDFNAEGSKDSSRFRVLVEENERLQENVAFLEARNEELRKTVEEFEQIKQENVQLKNRCKELLKSSKENNRPRESQRDITSPRTRARQFVELSRNPK